MTDAMQARDVHARVETLLDEPPTAMVGVPTFR